ncbi:MAG TPA: DapH/DapD/GlmU-related protein [Holophagaceae bacterium]|nr:DapH/DapD/GlmU-related protein [Holophagaceae bacterium]
MFPPGFKVHDSAAILGSVELGPRGVLAQGAVLRGRGGALRVGDHSLVLETCAVIGTPEHPARIGRETVFGHRCLVVGATVGDLCEIGNGAILMSGAVLGDGCILGEGALIPAGAVVEDHSVMVGSPARKARTSTPEDRTRILSLRGGAVVFSDAPLARVDVPFQAGGGMGRLYAYRGRTPQVDGSAVLFESAELTGDVTVGPGSIIGAGVKIIGDSHGPVRIGAGVQILENSVLHLLPDNELVIEDGVVIGPGCMIHGCRIGQGSIVEPGCNISDWSELGRGCLVKAGSVVKQRSAFGELSVIEGFPAKRITTLEAPPLRPDWAFADGELPVRVR